MGLPGVAAPGPLEQTRLFLELPELEEAGSSEEQEQRPQRPQRRGSGRWAALALSLAGLALVALCVLGLRAGRGPPPDDEPQPLEATEGNDVEAARELPDAYLEVGMLQRTPVREFEEVEIEDPPIWINKAHWAENATLKPAGKPRTVIFPDNERRLAGSCQDRLARVDDIRNQHLAPHASDDLFPASMSSIAEPGANCGDSARNIQESCSKYNKWKTFEEVAQSKSLHFDVIGSSGPNWHDIGQGELGTCYFLASLASIAYSDPQVIEDMFVDRHKWSQGIFTTRWLIGGQKMDVEVDNMIPARSWGTFFVSPSKTGEFWPVILEKTWAKIAGDFKSAEGGIWPNPVLAMTAAPLLRVHHDEKTVAEVLSLLEEATQSGWPMGAGTGPNCVKYGLSRSHAYSVFKVYHKSGYGKVIKVYNPWHSDHYKGQIPNTDESDGVFSMTPEEYHDAFDATSAAKVNNHYKVSTQRIQNQAQKTTAWEIDVTFDGEFSVSVNWPLQRMFGGCDVKDPKVTLLVKKQGSDDVFKGKTAYGTSASTATVTAGRGKYTVSAAVAFPSGSEVHEANLVVYAPDTVDIQASSTDPMLTIMSILGAAHNGKPCHNVFIKGYGNFVLKKDELVNNVPTYWTPADNDFAYWAPDQERWLIIGSKYLQQVRGGDVWSYAKVSQKAMTCGCQDDQKGVAGFSNVYCNMVKGENAVYGNVKCQNTEHSKLVQQYCPVTCDADFCRSDDAAAPAPTPPTPAPSPSGDRRSGGMQQSCEDQENPHITLNGKPATCTDLRDMCKVHSFVQEKCCSTCVKRAEEGALGDDDKCRDHTPPGLMNGRGRRFKSCQELRDHCDTNAVVPERCCATCHEGKEVREQCTDSSDPNLKMSNGRTFSCSGWAPYCSNKLVKEECCETCSSR